MKRAFLLFAIIPLISFSTCQNRGETPSKTDHYYISGTKEEQDKLENYFSLLENATGNNETQFVLVREIANTLIKQKEYGKLINFLSARTHKYPEDPYNPYYLFMIAFAYQQMEAYPMAALYFDMIVKNYPDLTVQGKSIHLACLTQLITIVDNPQQKEWYYLELIDRYLDQIEPGPSYFMLAQAHEGMGEWNSAIKAYGQYLSYLGSNVPGFPDADN
ncbi:MAG: tetratricopeptide repeat protein, partial [Treponema sp.]|nr:tetratricopeptide repeat protein [Treponema sp.]